MNILVLTNTYLPHVGGVARSVHAFAEEYRRRGHRVLIVAPEFENTPQDEIDVIRLPAIQNFNGSDFSVRIPVPGMLTAALEEFQPQIVHAHHPFLLGDTAVRIAAMRNLPLVFTHHTMYEQYTHYVPGDSSVLARFVVDLTTGYTNFCDAVIAPSESVAAVLRQRGVVAPIEVIPTGVDVEHFARGDGAAVRSELKIPPGAFVVGHVGRLAPEKNLPFLARSVAAFLRARRDAHLIVVGSGPSEEAIREAFSSPRYRGRLHFTGPLSGQRLVDAYHAMDVFAFASFSETQGMVLTEAMAAGVPVVAIDASGVREVVVDGVNGRLLASQNDRSFAAALEWVYRLPAEKRHALRKAARARAAEFSMQRTAEKALKLYDSLIAQVARVKTTDDSPWERAVRLIEAEWQLWSNVAEAAGATLQSRHIFRVPIVGTALYGWQILRRWFSRSEWGAKLLGLPPSTAKAEHGLILIQIDGLSRTQLERALVARRMPFLRRLLAQEGYELHTHYSGLPSTTAAVQGELFYGVKAAVPAYAYADRNSGELVAMTAPQAAAAVQQRIGRGQIGLLEGGSAYCNIYSGGAAEPHFCAAAVGWGDLLRYGNPFNILLFVLWNAGSLLRMFGLTLLEILLAVVDIVRGIRRGHRAKEEIKFIASRVGVTIVLRELVTIAASVDAARGLPVVQLNLLGYDEQSHRRGPDSAFAHWSLKGIDDAIKRVWTAARQSHRRDYVVWIYSDHGQERVTPYELVASAHRLATSFTTGQTYKLDAQASAYRGGHALACASSLSTGPGETGFQPIDADSEHPQAGSLSHATTDDTPRTIGQAVNEVFEKVQSATFKTTVTAGRASQLQRVQYLGGRSNKLIPRAEREQPRAEPGEIQVAALGPVGHIYLPFELSLAQMEAACRMLATTADVPLVLVPDEIGKARAWTSEGEFLLPDDAARVLGDDHPFLPEAATDLVELCHHPDSGDVVILGWRKGHAPISFAFENGAHGGAAPEETRGFAILPSDTALPETGRDYVRPAELRRVALDLLGRGHTTHRRRRRRAARQHLRIVTYNVHSCVGLDGRLSTSRIARVLAQCDADIVALQELDVRRPRSGNMDQAHELARLLEMEFHFHPALAVEEEHYGDAVLSRLPMRLVRAGPLPGVELHKNLEPRGALWVAVDVGGQELQLINTHLGLLADERLMQVEALLGPQWLKHPECCGPVVLCGDFNALPGSRTYRRLASQLRDTQKCLNGHRPKNTWFSHYPLSRIDHVFLGPELEVMEIETPANHLARVASDHLPLVVDLKLPGNKEPAMNTRSNSSARWTRWR